MTPLTSVFCAGFPKCATTWLHHNISQHPQITSTITDAPHWFNKNYFLGKTKPALTIKKGANLILDFTPHYIFRPQYLDLIKASKNKRVKFIVSLRNPVRRSVSQFNHEHRKGIINIQFEDIFTKNIPWAWNYFIESSFYDWHLENLYTAFPAANVFFTCVDHIKLYPEDTLKGIFSFLEIESSFIPRNLHKAINSANEKNNAHKPIGIEADHPFLIQNMSHLKKLFQPKVQKASAFLGLEIQSLIY